MSQLTRREQIAALRTQARAGRERRVYKRAVAGILLTALAVPLILAGILVAAAAVTHGWWHRVPPLPFSTAWILAYLLFAGYSVVAYVPGALRDWVARG